MRDMNRAGPGTRRSDSSSGAPPAPGRLPADLVALLGRLDRELGELYGARRYGGLVLYGSYARGEADEGSDVDLLVLLEGEVDPVRELIRLEDVKWPLALESGYALSVLAVSVEAYHSSEEPLLWRARSEGVPAA
jgi:predicted nucleotidyltransferase